MTKQLLLTAAVSALALGSCKEASEYEGYAKAENGLHYKFFNQDESAPKATIGQGIGIRYLIKKFSNDSVIWDSKGVSRDGSGIFTLMLQKSLCVGGIEDALMMMAKGDSATFLLNADSFFLKTNKMNELPPFIRPGEKLNLLVKMTEIKTQQEIEENQKKQKEAYEAEMKMREAEEGTSREKYLADNKITAKPTASGLIYIETKKGSGAHPKSTDEVVVHYTGKLLDGKVFDSSVERGQPATFPLDRVIPGWTEAIQLMAKGGKATLVIPSQIGYGAQGTGPIPPFSTLVFDVELIDFKAAAPQQAPPQQQPQ
jgi:FKBP-type peptidyl-prolyl cis-trans isomerase FkpA